MTKNKLRSHTALRALAALLGVAPALALAGATTDGSLGPEQTHNGHFTIPQSLGTLAGRNLFHSFSHFSIGAEERATFTTSDSSILNVISRVTGGEISTIHGALKLDAAPGSSPEFFFINPAGVVFGAGASIEVPAGFHVSTAQKLKFADGFAWDTGSPTSSLSIAAPEAFGFVGGTSAIKFNNLALPSTGDLHIAGAFVELDSATLSVGDASSIFVTGSNIKLLNSTVSSHNAQDRPPGRIAVTGGAIDVNSSSIISTTSQNAPAANIDIQARSLLIAGGDQPALVTSQVSSGESSTGRISVQLADELVLRNSGFILAGAQTSGTTAAINIRAGSVSIDGGGFFAGIANSQSVDVPGVSPGSIAMLVDHLLRIENGGIISTGTASAANAGAIDIRAASIQLDGKETFARITSEAFAPSTGSAGAIKIVATDNISLLRAADISASTSSSGAAGSIDLSAGTLTLDGEGVFARIASQSASGATGNAGAVRIEVADEVALRRGGAVLVSTEGPGHAGSIAIDAGSLLIERGARFDNAFTGLETGQKTAGQSGNPGSIAVTARANVSLLTGGEISSTNLGSGAGGPIDIQANSLTLDGGGILARISSQTFGDGDAGTITIKADDILVTNQGKIFSNTFGAGAAGAIDIESNTLVVRGPSSDTGISALASFGSSGQPGSVSIVAREAVRIAEQGGLTIENHAVLDNPRSVRPSALTLSSPLVELASGARITAETSGNVTASQLRLAAATPGGSLKITSDGTTEVSSSTRLPRPGEINNSALLPAHGSAAAGDVELVASDLSVSNALVASQAKAGTTGAGGQIVIRASETLRLTDGSSITTDTFGVGNAGNVSLDARHLDMNGAQVSSNTNAGAFGDAGIVSVGTSDTLTLANAARISSSSRSRVGAAGTVDVRVGGQARLLSGAHITTDTEGTGEAGNVTLSAGQMTIEEARVTSGTLAGSSGDGGTITIRVADSLTLAQGADISASTEGEGRAGSIELESGVLSVRGGSVQARAALGSSGMTGDVTVRAARSIDLEQGALLSIQNDALALARASARTGESSSAERGINNAARSADSAAGSTLSIAAPTIRLSDARVSASATGNIAASNLRLDASDSITLRDALLSTSAQDGDGGSISVGAGVRLTMERSAITTSVFGIENGNGGDIQLRAGQLLMNTGFVQANTAAKQASGGDIALDVGLLVATGALLLGGNEVVLFDPNLTGFNVIQAASPEGIAGTVDVSGPIIDASGNLRALTAAPAQETTLGSDLCRHSANSTFTPVSGGGLRLRADNWLRLEGPNEVTPIALTKTAVLGFIRCK